MTQESALVGLLRQKAGQGDAGAQIDLGVRCATGLGVPHDAAQAVQWYRKAAEQGHPRAQYNLGVRCLAGLGVVQDYAEAHMWFSIAHALSSGSFQSQCAENRERITSIMTAPQVAEAQKRAREWMEAFEKRMGSVLPVASTPSAPPGASRAASNCSSEESCA